MKHDLPQRDCTTLFRCMRCMQARKASLTLPCRGLGVRACGGGMLSRALVLALIASGTVDALRTQGKCCPAAFQSVGCLRRWQTGPMAPFPARSSVSATRIMSTKTAEPKVATATGNFDLKRYLAEKKAAVERALDLSVQPSCKEVKKITDSMRYSLLAGGKRIRPIMCIAACEMAGGTPEMAMPTAVALEMIHTMSLIHDDLPSMDNDSLRRGKPTNHVVYGEDVAILAGDALLSTAFEHVAKFTKGVPAERVVDVIARLGTSVGPVGLAGGQVMDLECEGKQGVGLQELTWIHTHKTAALLKVSVAAGAVLAGASKEEVAACEKYAVDIGLAFQVADDILDVTASTEALGKTAGKDLNMDKTTYPKLLGLDGSREEARRLVIEAKSALSIFGARAEPLLAIADYIVDREN